MNDGGWGFRLHGIKTYMIKDSLNLCVSMHVNAMHKCYQKTRKF